ncbi:SIS domain-containing protein [Roseomonas sp. BN140053]|uniref:SIS domain-containing protein n=1 Tax=Roseomonas sp. BN140053 TaxID=3391898 RepID=UPI0039E7E45E
MSEAADPGPMGRDVARQPEVLRALAARAEAFIAAGQSVLRPGPGGRLIVCGCGDGVFAGAAAAGWAATLGLDWRAAGALEMVLGAEGLREADRVIAVSMSGNVDRTVEAARAVEARGVPILALVNGEGGRLGAIAAARVSLDLPDVAPFLCGTSSYTATLAALMLLACGAAGSDTRPDLGAVAAAQEAALDAAAAVLPAIGLPAGVRVLSAGAELGTAQYGAAKLVELTHIPAWHGELEEFAHSQYWAMPAGDLVVVVASDPVLAGYADESCHALEGLGVQTLAVDTAAAPVTRATHRITLPAIGPALAPLATALPLQLLAASLARRGGLDPDTRAHLKQDAVRFRVSRQLTRRSLLGTGQ